MFVNAFRHNITNANGIAHSLANKLPKSRTDTPKTTFDLQFFSTRKLIYRFIQWQMYANRINVDRQKIRKFVEAV